MPRAIIWGKAPAPLVKTFRSAGVTKPKMPLNSRPVTKKELATIFNLYDPILQADRRDERITNDAEMLSWIAHLQKKHNVQGDASMPAQRLRDLIRHMMTYRLKTFNDAYNSQVIQILPEHPLSLDDEIEAPSDIEPGDSVRAWYDGRLSSERVDALISKISRTLWSLPEVKQLVECKPRNGWPLGKHWELAKYYPMQATDFIYDQAMRILAEVCYDFMKKHRPVYLKRKEIEYPEFYELPVWLNVVYEMLAMGIISPYAIKGSVVDAQRVMKQVRELRNHGVHGIRKMANEMIPMFEYAVDFARILGDNYRQQLLEKLVEELKKGPEFAAFLQTRQVAGIKEEEDHTAKIKVLTLLAHHMRAERKRVEMENREARMDLKRQFSIERQERLLKVIPQSSVVNTTQPAANDEEVPQSSVVNTTQPAANDEEGGNGTRLFQPRPHREGHHLVRLKDLQSHKAESEAPRLDILRPDIGQAGTVKGIQESKRRERENLNVDFSRDPEGDAKSPRRSIPAENKVKGGRQHQQRSPESRPFTFRGLMPERRVVENLAADLSRNWEIGEIPKVFTPEYRIERQKAKMARKKERRTLPKKTREIKLLLKEREALGSSTISASSSSTLKPQRDQDARAAAAAAASDEATFDPSFNDAFDSDSAPQDFSFENMDYAPKRYSLDNTDYCLEDDALLMAKINGADDDSSLDASDAAAGFAEGVPAATLTSKDAVDDRQKVANSNDPNERLE